MLLIVVVLLLFTVTYLQLVARCFVLSDLLQEIVFLLDVVLIRLLKLDLWLKWFED